MEATAKVTLDASGYEAGADKISRADAEMAGSAKVNFTMMGDAAKGGFDAASMAAEKGARSYRELREAAQQAGKVIDAESRRMREASDRENRARRQPVEPREGGGDHGAYSSRVRGQIGMHVATSVMDQTLAGQSPLRALEMEGPRMAELLGVGIGPTIGIAAAVAGIAKLVTSYREAAEAKREFDSSDTFVHGRATAPAEYDKEIERTAKARDTFREATGGKVNAFAETMVNIPRMVFGQYDPTKGDVSPQQQGRDQSEANASNHIVEMQSQKVDSLREENDLREQAVQKGERAVKVAQLDLEMRREIQAAQIKAAAYPELSADKETEQMEQIKRRYGMLKDQANFEQESYRQRARLQTSLAEIRSPGITKDKLGFDPEDLHRFSGVKSVAQANTEFSDSLETLQRTKDAGRDTTDASEKVRDKQAALAASLRAEKEEYDQVDKTVKIEQDRLNGLTNSANNASALLGIEQRITTATDNGKNAERDRLRALGDSITAAQKLDSFLHPEKGRADRAASEMHDRAQKSYDNSGGLLNVTRGLGGEVTGGTDPATGQPTLLNPGRRRMSAPNERAEASAKERDRQEHVYDKVGGSAIHDNVNNLLDFDNYFGTKREGSQDWMTKEAGGMGYRERPTGGGYGRVPLNNADFKASQPDTRDEDFNATAREGRSGMIDKVNFNQDARATREKMIDEVTPKPYTGEGMPDKAARAVGTEAAPNRAHDEASPERALPYTGATKAKDAVNHDDLIPDRAGLADNKGTPDRVVPDRFHPEKSVAEQNRPTQPDKSHPPAATIDPSVTALVAAINAFAAKVGVA